MRRFQAAVSRAGEVAPEGASLKRMFAYWEAGERAVTVPAYQRAFVEIYEAPPEALGFAVPDDTGRLTGVTEERLTLIDVDSALVEIVEGQTQSLRMLDRKLGSAALAAQAQAHVSQLDSMLHHSAGPARPALAAAMAEAAALAGWQALDRGDVRAAWEYHEQAKAAALESGDEAVLTHVLAQQALILLDAHEPAMAADAATVAIGHASATPPLMRAWLSAAYAEVLAANGQQVETRRRLERARELLDRAVDEDLPYLMLTPEHLARWRAHCLAKLGDLQVVDDIATALGGEGDSVRAATSLHTDVATAHLNAGDIPAALEEAEAAMRMAERYGSRRQRNRLLAMLARCHSEVVQQPDERA